MSKVTSITYGALVAIAAMFVLVGALASVAGAGFNESETITDADVQTCQYQPEIERQETMYLHDTVYSVADNQGNLSFFDTTVLNNDDSGDPVIYTARFLVTNYNESDDKETKGVICFDASGNVTTEGYVGYRIVNS